MLTDKIKTGSSVLISDLSLLSLLLTYVPDVHGGEVFTKVTDTTVVTTNNAGIGIYELEVSDIEWIYLIEILSATGSKLYLCINWQSIDFVKDLSSAGLQIFDEALNYAASIDINQDSANFKFRKERLIQLMEDTAEFKVATYDIPRIPNALDKMIIPLTVYAECLEESSVDIYLGRRILSKDITIINS